MTADPTSPSAQRVPSHILPIIVASQFAGTSPWFASNAVMGDIEHAYRWGDGATGAITSAVQLGFISGTLVFTVVALADRYSPRLVFACCALLTATSNCVAAFMEPTLTSLLLQRYLVGFFLAGVYPVGMKIAASWYARDLGKALGFLVAGLVVGTALPHLIRGLGQTLPWQSVLLTVSAIAATGGLLLYALVPDGPHHLAAPRPKFEEIGAILKAPDFRASSFGYFGHMWELYGFWTFLPAYVALYAQRHSMDASTLPFITFATIAIGAVGCLVGGYLALRRGSAVVATAQLLTSAACCLLSPIAFFWAPPAVMIAFLAIWGITVVGDSPQFSALNARNAPRDRVGTALTMVNCIGFAITIVAIQTLSITKGAVGEPFMFVLLAPGPVIGALAMLRLVKLDMQKPQAIL